MDKNTNTEELKKELILGDEFEKALMDAAEVKNGSISACKERNRNNYEGFYDIMLGSRRDIQELMNKKGKQKTDEDKRLIKEFKADVSKTYKQICDLTYDGELEDGEETKVQKVVSKVARVLKMMRYIGNTSIDDEFAKYGIELKQKSLEEDNDMFSQDHIRDTIGQIFSNGRSIREDIDRSNEEIKVGIYESSVPIDLQYDKNENPTGIKSSDWCKLVDLKAKMLNAKDDDAKEKAREQAESIASDYVFQNARNEILNKKVTELTV